MGSTTDLHVLHVAPNLDAVLAFCYSGQVFGHIPLSSIVICVDIALRIFACQEAFADTPIHKVAITSSATAPGAGRHTDTNGKMKRKAEFPAK